MFFLQVLITMKNGIIDEHTAAGNTPVANLKPCINLCLSQTWLSNQDGE